MSDASTKQPGTPTAGGPGQPNRAGRLIAVAAVSIVLVVAIVIVAINIIRDSGEPSASDSGTPSVSASATADVDTQTPSGATSITATAPKNSTDQGGLLVGDPNAPAVVSIYVDYMCSYCAVFEVANADDLQRLLDEGTIRIEMHPMSFVAATEQYDYYSTRTANAAATVADQAPDQLFAFNRLLFENQPTSAETLLSDEQIGQLALSVGVPQEVVDQFTNGTFVEWAGQATEVSLNNGITGTPAVHINGTKFEGNLLEAGPLAQAIESAK